MSESRNWITYDWGVKDPVDQVEYTIEHEELLDGDTIASVAWTVHPDLTVDDQSNTTVDSTVWLSGGVAGRNYLVVCTVTTGANPPRVFNRRAALKCRDL